MIEWFTVTVPEPRFIVAIGLLAAIVNLAILANSIALNRRLRAQFRAVEAFLATLNSEQAVDPRANVNAVVVPPDESPRHFVHGQEAIGVELRGVQKPDPEVNHAADDGGYQQRQDLPADLSGAHESSVG